MVRISTRYRENLRIEWYRTAQGDIHEYHLPLLHVFIVQSMGSKAINAIYCEIPYKAGEMHFYHDVHAFY